jgi:hypothetical protein
MPRPTDDRFDPIAVLQTLDRHRVTYIVIGALGRVIQGSDDRTDGIDIVPSTRTENLRRLALTLHDLNARRVDGRPLDIEQSVGAEPLLELQTDAGELKIVPEPAGTRGYDDLRRGASREPLGHGVRPSVASIGDHARMLAALHREQDIAPLHTLRRLVELERELSRGPSLER